jgi:Virulence-associated protein E
MSAGLGILARPAWPARACRSLESSHRRLTCSKSQTGNRRFWPVTTGRVDIEALARDRDHLWAEAAALEAEGASIMLPESLWPVARELQESRREVDPWEEILAEVRGSRVADEDRVFSQELLSKILQIPTDRLTDTAMASPSHCMKQLAWPGPKTLRIGIERKKGYFRPADGPAPLALDD